MQKAVLAVLVLFIGFWLFHDPHGLAETSKHLSSVGASGVGALFQNVITFVSDL